MVGDPEAVLNRCATALIEGRERPIDDDYKSAFRYACNELGGLGERLVALCDWRLSPQKFPPGYQFNSQNINFPLRILRTFPGVRAGPREGFSRGLRPGVPEQWKT